MTYGLRLYGTAYQISKTKTEAVQRRILQAVFFQKTHFLESVFADVNV